ncbi:TonB-dependent siderophore receptor [Sphingomonas sp. NCPPB 2930]
MSVLRDRPPAPSLRTPSLAPSTTACATGVVLCLLVAGPTRAQTVPEPSLSTVTVTGGDESATGPVPGFVAKRAATATKTDTPLAETPQSISVVTRDQIEAQGALTLRQTTAYSAGVVSSYFDSRVDSFRARGGDVAQYQDGMLRTYGTYNSTKTEPYTLERVELLRGPSSVLYGQGGVGGLLNIVSKRPQAETLREIQVQAGSYDRRQLAIDFTGPLDAEGKWLYRFVAVGRDSGAQVNFVRDDRVVLAPSLTWRPSADTSLTLQALHQNDKSGSLIGFFPWQGTLFPAPFGPIPTATFTGEPGYDAYDSKQNSLGYLFSHRFDDTWTVRQNFRAVKTEVDYRTAYTSFVAVPGTGRPARPVFNADNRTINRDLTQQRNGGEMLLLDNQAEARFATGAAGHTVLAGLDAQRNVSSTANGRGRAAPLDVYNPVYGDYTAPTSLTASPDVTQRQLGLYLQDQIKWGRWAATLGLRHDTAQTDSTSAKVDDNAWTKRAGLVYLADSGWAPYVSYTESFLPLGGVDLGGTPFKPQRGKQYEAGVRWQPAGGRGSLLAAVYDLRDTNRKTGDPANPLNSIQIGEVHIKGLELEGKLSLPGSWDATAAYAWTDAKVSRATDATQGKRVSGVPEQSASFWLSRRFALGGRGGFTAGGGVRYLGASWDGTDTLRTPASTLFDAFLAYDTGPWRLALNAVNLTDKVQITTCLTRGDCFYGQRRTVTATATYRF